jgi:tetratricopeptide (TPR) repeat protein
LRKTHPLRTVHYFTILIAIFLIAGLYKFGNTIPPKKDGALASTTQAGAKSSVSFETILKDAKHNLSTKSLERLSAIDDRIAPLKDSTQMVTLFDSLSSFWEKENHQELEAQYSLLAGKFGNSEKKLTFAAQLFLKLADANQNEAVRTWEAMQAMFGFQQVIALNANNESAKVGLAQCYLGTGNAMQGVLMLRELAEKNPENVEANLLLGQQGIVSGQLDKAQKRFEKVLQLEPTNVEAMLGLAEVFKNKGDKQKAIDLLQKAKKKMNSPEFSKDIDQYINTF